MGLGPELGFSGDSPGGRCFSTSSAALSWYTFGSFCRICVICGVCVLNIDTNVWCADRRMSGDLGSLVQVMIFAKAISLSLLIGMSGDSTKVTRDRMYARVASFTLLLGVCVWSHRNFITTRSCSSYLKDSLTTSKVLLIF